MRPMLDMTIENLCSFLNSGELGSKWLVPVGYIGLPIVLRAR
jgi:hypothetical protein